MKILSANKFYYLNGGSDRYFFELNELHLRNGIDVVPFAMHHPKNLYSPYQEYFVSEVNYWNNPTILEKVKAATRVVYSQEASRQALRLIEATHPDLAHLHIIAHQISPSFLPVLKHHQIPIVQTLHDYKPICPSYGLVSHGKVCERCKGGRFVHAALQRCNHDSFLASSVNTLEMYLHHLWGWYELPDRYICPSQFMLDKMVEFGLSANKLVHIPNFVDGEKYPFSQSFGNYLVYVGRLVEIKGVQTLLHAMGETRELGIELFILGDGPQRQELEKLKETLNLDRVHFLGHQDNHRLVDIVSHAMCTILPSEVYEICPMSILESMAMGTPVIGSSIGGIPEIIEDQVDGFLFKPGDVLSLADTIKGVVKDKLGLSAMRQVAYAKIAEKYNPQVHHEKILALYKDILS